MSDVFHSQFPKQGPSGFEIYEIGPDNARIELYKKHTKAHLLLFNCDIFSGVKDERDAVCSNYASPLANGNALSYRLNLKELSDAEAIDDGLRHFVGLYTK